MATTAPRTPATATAAEVTFPAGIEVRPTRPEDRDLLLAFLDGLPVDDRRLRFFGTSAPAAHVDRWLRLHEDGGETFVALTTDEHGQQRCVGEASYAPRGDGTAEFALSVAVDARGGLGTALLEFLRRRAAARGLRALHGDVLTRNAPMTHLMRRRGGVTIDREDSSSVAVLLATDHGAPPWPDHEPRRPRVLVESRNGRWGGETRLREAGVDVAVCPGPTSRPATDPCPLLVGERCELVDGADVVVHDLDPDEDLHLRVARALRTAAAPTPLVARAPDAGVVPVAAVEDVLRDGTPA
jgi:GNAT superfamily N-acetyltransferase